MIVIVAPRRADVVMVGEGHAPVVAVLDSRAQADESIAAPKGFESWPPGLFPANRPFLRDMRRGHHRHLGPWQADAGRWAKAMPRCGSASRVCVKPCASLSVSRGTGPRDPWRVFIRPTQLPSESSWVTLMNAAPARLLTHLNEL
jgi:hypothetical protein